jgi:hypothetical protein
VKDVGGRSEGVPLKTEERRKGIAQFLFDVGRKCDVGVGINVNVVSESLALADTRKQT